MQTNESTKELPMERIMVTMDSLIDTRLGTILGIDPKAFDRVVTPFYYERVIDEFNGINPEVFKREYAKRDVETLQRSMVTYVPLLLKTLIKNSASEVLRAGPQTRVIITINTHPYDLTDDEKHEIMAAMEILIGDSVEYECVRIPPEFLTPQIVKNQFAVLVMYEFADWFRMHAEGFRETRMQHVLFYAPMLLEKKPSDEEIKEFTDKGLDLFEAARLAASPAFQLHFLTTDVFSIKNAARDVKEFQMRTSRTDKVDEYIAAGKGEGLEEQMFGTQAPT